MQIEVVQWLQELAKKDGVRRELDAGKEFKSFEKFAKRVQESKGSYQCRRHYVHYKVLAQEEDL